MKHLCAAVAAIVVAATALSSCEGSKGGAGGRDAGGGTAGSDAGTSDARAADASDAGDRAGSCRTDTDCTAETECAGGTCTPKAVCPAGLEATFDSLRSNVFAVSCGTSGAACHSTRGSIESGGLDLADDPYTALLGPDGKGAPAGNIAGSERNLRRVVPGDPDHSFLLIKLSTRSSTDPKYGSGMPFTDPGSVCPDTLATIRTWIAAGAAK